MALTKRMVVFGCIWLGLAQSLHAQIEPNEIASASDQFQDAFYESLTQKGIENYDKAVLSLEKCQALEPNNAVVYFELGKNYLAQKEYNRAHEAFQKATELDPMNRWFWVGLYDVFYETKAYEEAIPVVKQLIEFNLDYQEDLVSLYMNTQQFDKALVLINELNESKGNSELRDKYRAQILGQGKYQSAEIDRLLAEIKSKPQEESNYLSLIFLYSDQNQDEKALEVAKKLEKNIPTSDWAQVSLFKYHLVANEGIQAAKSLQFVLASPKVESKIKHRMLNEFLLYIQDKPQFDADFDKAVGLLVQDPTVAVNKEVGKFYQRKKNAAKAIYFYTKQLLLTPDDIETLRLLCDLYTETGQFDVLATTATEAVDRFPLQPQWYYYAGLANNQLKNSASAIALLESGLEYVVDDKALEINFYIQLGEAHHNLGNVSQKEFYFNKAEMLVQQAQKK
jgi:tetratricopeptide (TPR) repeat protein